MDGLSTSRQDHMSVLWNQTCVWYYLNADMADNYGVDYVVAKDVTEQVFITFSNVTCCVCLTLEHWAKQLMILSFGLLGLP